MTTYHGPISYANWKAALDEQLLYGSYEYPLFTDSQITGEIVKEFGPYELFNTYTMISKTNTIAPSIVLRMAYHLPEENMRMDMNKTDALNYHGGWLHDEIAALLSLNLAMRVKAGGCTRRFRLFRSPRDEKGYPIYSSLREDPVFMRSNPEPVLPYSQGKRCLNDAFLLEKLPYLSSKDASTIVKAARLYQDAIWLSESEPEISWLLLVSSAETAAEHWKSKKDSHVDILKEFHPSLVHILEESGDHKLVDKVAKELAGLTGATKKFVDFIMNFLPPSPPENRPPAKAQHPWEMGLLRESLTKVYMWRSRALHGGIPFPAPMCNAPMKLENGGFWEKPDGLSTQTRGAVWVAKDTPMLLHFFEYIVRNVLLNWWKSLLPKPYSSTKKLA